MGQDRKLSGSRHSSDEGANADCPACGHARPRVPPKGDRSHYRCLGCKSLVRWHWPDAAGLAQLYASAWSEADQRRFATGATSAELARDLVGVAGTSPTGLNCLDFGAGRGTLAHQLVLDGACCVAVEPFGPDPGIEGVRWFNSLADARPLAPYDLIYAIEVIEHHRCPSQCLTELTEDMDGGSLLVITTPNSRGLNARLLGQRWRELHNLTHLCLFSPAGLRSCADRAGLELRTRHSGSVGYRRHGLRLILQRALQRLRLDGSLRMVFAKSDL